MLLDEIPMQITFEGKISIFLTLLGLAGAGAVMIFPERIWIGWLLIASAAIGLVWLGFHHFDRRFFVVPVAACALIFDGWFYSSQLSSTPALGSIPAPGPKASPSPTASPKASQSLTPPPPWVSAEEIEREHKTGRILLPFTVDELANMNVARQSSGNGSNMDAYVGKWVKISGSFKQLSKRTLSDKKEYLVVTTLDQIWLAYLLFDSKKWDEALVRFKVNDRLTAMCQLYGFTSESGPIFSNCEVR
jgi:hypothetical protein